MEIYESHGEGGETAAPAYVVLRARVKDLWSAWLDVAHATTLSPRFLRDSIFFLDFVAPLGDVRAERNWTSGEKCEVSNQRTRTWEYIDKLLHLRLEMFEATADLDEEEMGMEVLVPPIPLEMIYDSAWDPKIPGDIMKEISAEKPWVARQLRCRSSRG